MFLFKSLLESDPIWGVEKYAWRDTSFLLQAISICEGKGGGVASCHNSGVNFSLTILANGNTFTIDQKLTGVGL